MPDFIEAARSTTVVNVVPSPEVTERLAVEGVCGRGYSNFSTDTGVCYDRQTEWGLCSYSKREVYTSTKPKGIVIGTHVVPAAPTSEEGGSILRDDDYNPLSVDGSALELTKEEQLALALKASIDTGLEERAAR